MTSLPPRLFCDTSFFYACFDPSDANHERARTIAEAAAAGGSALSVTWDIVSETVTLLRDRRGYRAALTFLDEVTPQLGIVPYGDPGRAAAAEVFRRYSRDHRLSFCDAISFVVVRTLLKNTACLAFDEDFRALGLTVLP